MIRIEDKQKCCGCTACVFSCPLKCITMEKDFEGFLYPVVDTEKCVECGACGEVCPVQNPIDVSKKKKETFAVRTKNIETLMKSTSGGFFTPIAKWVIQQNGIVCAAAYDELFNVKHMFIEQTNATEKLLGRARGSKYVQSDLRNSYLQVKTLLESGRLVCFIGTPCQVAGLKKYLGSYNNNLITIDLVCHGTPSPKLWKKYIEYQEKKYNAKITSVSFRNKTYGYHSSTMTIDFENGKTYNGSARVDYMLRSFFKEISSRPSCYNCAFKTIERCSDFTIYDCWHIAQLVPEIKDDDRGYTNVIVQSERGKWILDQIKDDLEIYPVDTEKAIELDGIMVLNSAKPHDMRETFYKTLDEESLEKHIQKFIPVRKKDEILERVKRQLYKWGILNAIKKIVKRRKR